MELLFEPKIAVVAGNRREFETWVLNNITYITCIDDVRSREFDLAVEVGTFRDRPFRITDEFLTWLRRIVKPRGE